MIVGVGVPKFVTATARYVVANIAVEELEFFDVVSTAYCRNPGKLLADRVRPGEQLGSGFDTVVPVVSPVALAVAFSVYQHLVDRAGEAVVRRGVHVLRRLRRRVEPDPELLRVGITRERLDEVKALAVARATELGLSPEDARRLADALCRSLEREDNK